MENAIQLSTHSNGLGLCKDAHDRKGRIACYNEKDDINRTGELLTSYISIPDAEKHVIV